MRRLVAVPIGPRRLAPWVFAALLMGLCVPACGGEGHTGGGDDDAQTSATDSGQQADTGGVGDAGGGGDDGGDDGGAARGIDAGGAQDTGAGGVDGADGADGCGAESCNGEDDDCDGETDEQACDDGEPCTEDACDAAAGACKHTPLEGGCDDGSKCTVGDVCEAGKCKAGAPKSCDDGEVCTADTCAAETGECGHTPAPDGGACDDGSACTDKDACKGGVCEGAKVGCPDGGPCETAVCLPASGCTLTDDEGKACDDGDLCTGKDTCKAGACQGEAVNCLPDGPCKAASCDAKTGKCVQKVQADVTACEDNNPCTIGDFCLKGECVPGGGKDCSMASPCLIGACNPGTGACDIKKKADGTACSDKNACTSGDKCGKGVCVGDPVVCDDKNPCTKDTCDPFTGCKALPNTAPCDDNNPCTQKDACKGGKCVGASPKVCDDKLSCTVDSCDKLTGGCVNDAKALEGKACDADGDVCTKGDKCVEGKCVVGSAKACDDGKPCTADTCDPKTGQCTFTKIAPGGACFDGSLCTYKDICDDKGGCSGIAIPCKDNNPCTADGCKAKTGDCIFTPIAAGKSCDDGDLCTQGDLCDVAGDCASGPKKVCKDANPCTQDLCDAKSGKCSFPGFSGPCDDGDACTQGEKCSGGNCKVGKDGDVTTLAGSGLSGWFDGPGTSARFTYPRDVAVAKDGVVFVADYNNHRIRRIAKDGTVSTFAGTGSGGWTDGPGGSARFYYPAGVAMDRPTGTLYVADRSNHRIRRVGSTGSVATLAGSGASGWQDGPGATARFYYPEGVAVGPGGALWVADTANHRIRKISPAGVVTTLAGSTPGFADGKGPAARFSSPMGIDVDGLGNAFVTDYGNQRIRVVQPGGVVTTLAGSSSKGFLNGQGSQARFYYPVGIALSPAGYLVVGDMNNCRLRKITLTGGVSTFSGSGVCSWLDGGSAAARFKQPKGVDVGPSGLVVVADHGNHRVRLATVTQVLCDDGSACTIDSCLPSKGCQFIKLKVGQVCQDGSKCTLGDKCDASGKCVGKSLVCDDGNLCTDDICHAATGKCDGLPNTKPCDDGDKCAGTKLCQAGACKVSQKVSTFAGNGSSAYKNGLGTSASIYAPQGMASDAAGNLYVAQYYHHRIRKIGADGMVSSFAGSGQAGFTNGPLALARFFYPADVTVASDGTFYVADRQNHRIRRISGGAVSTLAGSGLAGWKDGQGGAARFYYPEGVAVDKQGTVYVADTYNNRVRKITPAGLVTTLAGNGIGSYLEGKGAGARFYRPVAIAVDDGGTVFVADTYNHRIRRILPDGTTSLIAGGSAGWSDGVGATARFYYPRGVALGAGGTVYVSDYQNHRLRVIQGNAVYTLAGGKNGFLDGPTSQARFYYPWGLAVTSQGLFVADRNNNRIRRISATKVDCDDGNSCTTDACAPKTGKCSHTPIPNCCAKEKLIRNFNDASQAVGLQFYTCVAGKTYYIPTGCKPATGAQGTKGWQVWTSAVQKTSPPGALYYGDIVAKNYNWGASAGAVRLPAVKLPVGAASVEFKVLFSTEVGTSYDQLKAFLIVDGVRVVAGSASVPNAGAFFQKGSTPWTQKNVWYSVKVDLTKWSNKTVQVEFYFNTADPINNTGQGVFIDDFKINGTCPGG